METVWSTAFLYLFTFLSSIITFYFAERNENRKARCFILLCISIMIPTIIAALRADTVGADTAGYGTLGFKYLMSYRSLGDVFNNSEWLFYTIGYAITRVTDNVGWWLGIIEFLVICPFTIGAWKLRKRLPATFLIALFYFKFYNYSLCIMRQSISCSLLFLAIVLYHEKKYFKMVILALASVSVHSSGLAILLVVIAVEIYLYISAKKNKKKKNRSIIFPVAVIVSYFCFISLVNLFVSKGIIPQVYIERFLPEISGNGGGMSNVLIFESIYRMIYLGMIYLIRDTKTSEELSDMINLSIIGNMVYIVFGIGFGTGTIYRLTETFDFCNLVAISLFAQTRCIRVGHKNVQRGLIMLLAILYWAIVYMIFPGGIGFQTEIFKFR